MPAGPRYADLLANKVLPHIPPGWVHDPEVEFLFVAAYHSAGVPAEQVSGGPKVFRIGHVLAITMRDTPEFHEGPRLAVTSVGDTSVTVHQFPQQMTTWPAGIYTYFVTAVPGLKPEDIPDGVFRGHGIQNVDAAVAVAGIILGGNFVYCRAFHAYVRLRPLAICPVPQSPVISLCISNAIGA